MTIYPSIDLREGRVVRLLQGRKDAETVYFDDPKEPARLWKEAGAEWVHVVDLDGAFTGRPQNWKAVEAIAEIGLKIEMGGGLRREEDIERAFRTGVSRVVLGTRAADEISSAAGLVAQFENRLAIGIDAREGKVAVEGWVKITDLSALDLAREAAAVGIRYIVYTDIARDGMLTGPNFKAQRKMLGEVGSRVVASGGVSKTSDIEEFLRIDEEFSNFEGVVIGKALYENRLDLAEVIRMTSV